MIVLGVLWSTHEVLKKKRKMMRENQERFAQLANIYIENTKSYNLKKK